MSNIDKKVINFWIFFSALILFSIRWYNPLINFDEKIDISIIFDSISDGYIYFAQFKAFANLDLNYSFDPSIKNLNNLTIPTGAFYLHFIFNSSVIASKFSNTTFASSIKRSDFSSK